MNISLDDLAEQIDAGDVPAGVSELLLSGLSGEANRYAGPWPDEVWNDDRGPLLSRVLDAFAPGSLVVLQVSSPTVTLSGDWSDPRETHYYTDDCAARVARAPACRELRELTIHDSGLTADGAKALGARVKALLPRLADLRLD